MGYIRKHIIEFLFIIFAVFIFVLVINIKGKIPESTASSEIVFAETSKTESIIKNKTIKVYISGDVYNEGSFNVPFGSEFKTLWIVSRPKSFINPNDYNMSEKLISERHYIIKSEESILSGILVNVNYASEEELTILPGVGEVKAKSIIEFRDNNGLFTNIESFYDLLKGVSSDNLSKIKNIVTLG